MPRETSNSVGRSTSVFYRRFAHCWHLARDEVSGYFLSDIGRVMVRIIFRPAEYGGAKASLRYSLLRRPGVLGVSALSQSAHLVLVSDPLTRRPEYEMDCIDPMDS